MLQIASYTSGKSEKFEGGGLYWTTEMGTGEGETSATCDVSTPGEGKGGGAGAIGGGLGVGAGGVERGDAVGARLLGIGIPALAGWAGAGG